MKKVKNKNNQTQFINEQKILMATPFKSSKSDDWYIRLNMEGAAEPLLIGPYENEAQCEQIVTAIVS